MGMGLRDQDQPREAEAEPALPLVRLNHVSFSCASLEASVDFYRRVLGFELVQRPASLDFKGAWMHKYDMGIHLLQLSSDCDVPTTRPPATINPKGNHISFQCSDMALMKARLRDMDLELVTTRVWDGETTVEQLFFHDPDGNMIEICNCENLPVLNACLALQRNRANLRNPVYLSPSGPAGRVRSPSPSRSSFYLLGPLGTEPPSYPHKHKPQADGHTVLLWLPGTAASKPEDHSLPSQAKKQSDHGDRSGLVVPIPGGEVRAPEPVAELETHTWRQVPAGASPAASEGGGPRGGERTAAAATGGAGGAAGEGPRAVAAAAAAGGEQEHGAGVRQPVAELHHAARAHLCRLHRPGDQRLRPDADGQAHAHARPHRGVRLDRRHLPDGLQRVPGPRRPLRGSSTVGVHTSLDRLRSRALHPQAALRRGDQVQHEVQGAQFQHGQTPRQIQHQPDPGRKIDLCMYVAPVQSGFPFKSRGVVHTCSSIRKKHETRAFQS